MEINARKIQECEQRIQSLTQELENRQKKVEVRNTYLKHGGVVEENFMSSKYNIAVL